MPMYSVVFPLTRQLAALACALGLLAPGAAEASRQGHPQRTGPGVDVTTAEMGADALGKMPRREQPEEYDQTPRAKDPNPRSLRRLGLRSTPRARTRSAGTSVGLSFDGPGYPLSHAYPPDTQGDVGPTQFVAMINGRIRSYSKTTGLPDGGIDMDTDTFWASVMTPVGGLVNDNFTTDPHIRYDPLSDRWYAVMIDVPGTAGNVGDLNNRVMVAASDSGTITPATHWHLYSFQAQANRFSDYPTLGIDANALYIGTNDFTLTGHFANSSLYVVRKSSLATGSMVVTPFLNVINSTTGVGPFTPQGVDNPTPGATTGWFAGVDEASFGKIDLLAVSHPDTTPVLSAVQTVNVAPTQHPVAVPYFDQGGAGALDAIDDRLYAAHIRDGHLWTAHNVGVDSSGSSAGTADRTASRWYDISLPGSPSLANSGTIYDPAASTPRSYWMPSVAVTGQGTMAIGGSVAGAAARPDAWFGTLKAGGSALSGPTPYTTATADYQPPYNRWGDYSLTRVDPEDDQTVWTIQEYVTGPNAWGTRVAKLLAPAPAAPASVSPASTPAGTSSVHLSLSAPAGTGWFDPGTGFADRFAVTDSCGAPVSNVSLTAPNTVTLDLDTHALGDATCSFTVTNPDGQSATGTGLFTTGQGAVTVPTTTTDTTPAAPPSVTTPTTPTTPAPTSTTPTKTTPAPPAPAVVLCVVPSLRGHTLGAARRLLARAHCKLGTVRRVRRAAVGRGRVVASTPRAGRRLARGARISLVLRG
jgi:hypothetical protein